MPLYTIKNRSTKEEFEVQCTDPELQIILSEDPDLIQKLSSPGIVSGVGGVHSKTPSGFKDLLGRIKKGSGRGNTIRT